jgi:hypothetical protein
MASEYTPLSINGVCAMPNISATCDTMGGRMGTRALLEIWLQSIPTCDIVSIRMTPELPPLL